MSKLDLLENAENREQLNKFLKYNNLKQGETFKAKIISTQLELYNVDVNITNNSNSEWADINIIWENNGLENYRDLGLYGYYRSSYNYMKYDSKANMLSINNNEIQIYL